MPEKKKRSNTFRSAVNVIVRSIPEYKADPWPKINETIKFRNQMILEMCRGVHESFNGRICMKTSTTARNIYSTASDISLLLLTEELPKDDKLNVQEEFSSEEEESEEEDAN